MEVNELVKLAKNGDNQAFGAIYDLFAQRIFKFIRLKIQDRQEAEDILQEVFIKAHRGLANLKLQELNFNAWLYRIASNSINDFFRKKYRTPEIIGMDEKFDVADKISLGGQIEVKSDIEMLQKIFAELPPAYKQILELRFMQEFSVNEAAKILNKSNLSVRLLQHRALKKVKLILKNDEIQ